MNIVAHIIDDEGFVIDSIVVELADKDTITDNMIIERPPLGISFYKMKWNGSEWVEGKTQEEFDEEALFNSLIPSDKDLNKAELEITIISLLMEIM